MKILTICPSFGRPELFKQMYESWGNTINENNTMIVGLDIGDAKVAQYPKNVNKVMCKADSTVTQVINSIWKENPDYDFYHIINDDVVFHTSQFDTKFLNIHKEYGDGVFYGNDLFQKKNLPTFPFVSACLPKALGYLQMPTLNRYCGDTVYGDIGRICNCLYYLPGVIIEHLHKLAGKGDTDVDMKIYGEDVAEYVRWSKIRRYLDVMKVKEVLNG